MRVCLMNSFMWKMGGAEVFFVRAIRALTEKSEYEVSVVCEKMPRVVATYLKDFDVNVVETGFAWKGSGRTIKAGVGWAILPVLSRRISRVLDRIKPEVLNPHNFQDVFYAACYKKRNKNVRTIWFCHEPYRPFYDDEVLDRGSMIERVFFTVYRNFFARLDINNVRSLVDNIGANSKYTAKQVRKIYGKKSKVVYPGVDINLFRRIHSNSKSFPEPVILSVSSLDFSYKNSKIIPLLLSCLKRKYDVRWIHIGSGKDKLKLLKLARTLKVQDSLTILDFVPISDLVEYYSAADAVVYPPTREPFGLVPLEAMACETPVVASKYGGTAETIVNGKTGLLVDTNSISETTAAISRVLEDETFAKQMGKLGRRRVTRHFTWKQNIKNFTDLF